MSGITDRLRLLAVETHCPSASMMAKEAATEIAKLQAENDKLEEKIIVLQDAIDNYRTSGSPF